MNKQQLAQKIWQSANKMRSKIEANEYKDYILGFIFYKVLSDGVEKKLRADGWDFDFGQSRGRVYRTNTDVLLDQLPRCRRYQLPKGQD